MPDRTSPSSSAPPTPGRWPAGSPPSAMSASSAPVPAPTCAPGTRFIAGAYAVVSPTEPAVLVAVDRCITVRLTESEDAGRIHSSEYGRAPLVWRREQGGEAIVLEHRPADYVLSAISTLE